MNYVVEVRYIGGDWADLIADMRSWLDRRHIEAEEFGHSALGRGIIVRVGFRDQDHAAAFATAFSGRLERTDLNGAATARRTIVGPAGIDGDRSFSEDLTASDEPLTASARPTANAGVSLMITLQQKADLRKRGYTAEQIRDMKPQEAHRVLGLID